MKDLLNQFKALTNEEKLAFMKEAMMDLLNNLVKAIENREEGLALLRANIHM